jgi:nucleotide-binding universal stress UspA family protein
VDDITADPPMEMYAAQEVAKIVEASRHEGQALLKGATALGTRKRIELDTVQVDTAGRSVSQAILREAEMWKADLIVMGTHGRRGLQRLILGSDAERVVRESGVPVLLTRAPGSAAKGGERKMESESGNLCEDWRSS